MGFYLRVLRPGRVLETTAIGVTLLLYVIPYGHVIGRPLLYLSTLVHELGHGMTAILVGGDFHRLEMWSDGSGVAWNSARSDGQHGLHDVDAKVRHLAIEMREDFPFRLVVKFHNIRPCDPLEWHMRLRSSPG